MRAWWGNSGDVRCPMCGSSVEVLVEETRDGTRSENAERCSRCRYRQSRVRLRDVAQLEEQPVPESPPLTSRKACDRSSVARDKFGMRRDNPWV